MVWLLRIGIIIQFLGAISLSTSLVFIFVREKTIRKWLERIVNLLNRFLNWLLNTVYGRVRLGKMSPSKWGKLKQNYIAVLIILVIAWWGYVALSVAIVTHNVIAIIISVPFAILSGWIFSKAFNNRVLKVMSFVFFTAFSVFVYLLLISGAALHILLLSTISCIALFNSMLEWLARRRVRRAMLVAGGLLLAIGMALQFASTF